MVLYLNSKCFIWYLVVFERIKPYIFVYVCPDCRNCPQSITKMRMQQTPVIPLWSAGVLWSGWWVVVGHGGGWGWGWRVGVGRGVKGILLASWQTVLNPEEFGGWGEFGLKTVIRGRKGLEPEAGQMVKVGRDILQWDAKAVFVTTVIAHGAKSNPNSSMQCRVAVIQCGEAANVQTYTYGRCYDITRPCVNNGIKTFRRTNLFRQCYVHIFFIVFQT